MSKILELREKRAKAWESAKKFLDSKHGIFYGKSETWIESEKLYEVLYEMEV